MHSGFRLLSVVSAHTKSHVSVIQRTNVQALLKGFNMAYLSENNHSAAAATAAAMQSVGAAIVNFMLDLYNAGSRSDLIKELQSMDDAELLTTHGIKRSQIVAYVFRDKMVP